jgi:hypothetical protein
MAKYRSRTCSPELSSLHPSQWAAQNFDVVIDTGSSDPWLAGTNFQCVDYDTYDDQPEEYCNFGPLYEPANSTTFTSIANRNMNLSNADGESINGLVGYEAYTIAGITVAKQQFGIVNWAAWLGDGIILASWASPTAR